MKIWIARDPRSVYRNHKAICLFFGERPALKNGWWYQPGDSNGRQPIDQSPMRLKPGEIRQLKFMVVKDE